MNRRRQMVETVLRGHPKNVESEGSAFAAANIALVKYWGKRDPDLNLPVTSSLSVSLTTLGSHTTVRPAARDEVYLDGGVVPAESSFARRIVAFLDLFRCPVLPGFRVETRNTIPTAAGLASSASGFAALVRALDACMGWGLSPRDLSILARLGSGSACRSIFDGFVEWRAGEADDGLDSYAEPLTGTWPGLRIGLVVLASEAKPVGSSEAMNRTTSTSPLYPAWPATVARDLEKVRSAIVHHDLESLGRTAEGNALAMHATMIAARPSVLYWQAASLDAMAKVRALRDAGTPVWFTMDAGPNLKLIYAATSSGAVRAAFPDLREIAPFDPPS